MQVLTTMHTYTLSLPPGINLEIDLQHRLEASGGCGITDVQLPGGSRS